MAANVNIPNIRLYISVFLSFSYLFQFVDGLPALRDARDEVGGGRAAEVVPDLADEVAGGDEAGHLGTGSLAVLLSLSHSGNMGTHMLLFVHLLSQREREWGKAFLYPDRHHAQLTSVLYVKHNNAVTLFLPTEVTHSSANSSFNSKPILKTHVCLEYVPERG